MTNEQTRLFNKLLDRLEAINESKRQPQLPNDRLAGLTVRNEAEKRSQLADDLLVGLKAISNYTGISVRRVTYAVEMGRIPVFKLGKTVCARRSEIDAALRASAGTAA